MDLLSNFSFLVGSLILLAVLFIILRLLRVAFTKLIIGTLGLLIGLLISALLNIFVSQLPDLWGRYIPYAVLFLFGFGGVYLSLANEKSFNALIENIRHFFKAVVAYSESEKKKKIFKEEVIVVDTSSIIDGRIEDVIKTGFISGKFLITEAVIEELHHLSDSQDNLKRERGRRGLKILEKIQKAKEIKTEIIKDEFPNIKEVDKKLVEIAKKEDASILTVDYNLNKVAKIHNVRVLNVNELANSLRMVLLPGEETEIKIVQEGKEKKQGIGFLPDGTMIVVDDAKDKVGQKLKVKVIKSFQTEAGRMIFAEIVEIDNRIES